MTTVESGSLVLRLNHPRESSRGCFGLQGRGGGEEGGRTAYAAQNRLKHRDGTRTLSIEELNKRDRDERPSLVVRPIPGRPLPAAYAPSMALCIESGSPVTVALRDHGGQRSFVASALVTLHRLPIQPRVPVLPDTGAKMTKAWGSLDTPDA